MRRWVIEESAAMQSIRRATTRVTHLSAHHLRAVSFRTGYEKKLFFRA
jgi:hypothetical protein